MLIQVSVRNFKAFKEKMTFNLTASNYDKETLEEDNVVLNPSFNLRVLKSAIIYGANASGKSKFIDALEFMRDFAITSSKDTQIGDPINVEPFRLEIEASQSTSEFEVIFIYKEEMFRFGFEVNKERVVSEWLYHKPKTKEVELFYRQGQKIERHPRQFQKAGTLIRENLVRPNALLLSVAAQFNDENAAKVLEWFKNLGTISGLEEEVYQGFTMFRTKDPEHKKRTMNLLKAADLGIDDIVLEALDLSKLPKNMPKDIRDSIEKRVRENKEAEFVSDVLTTHKRYDANLKYIDDVQFSMETDESAGTKTFFALTGPILDSLENGYVLFVDELDSKMHPNLVCKIVELFNSKDLNPKNAQLIFNTHDTNLLSSGLFRRDQIWFTEKDSFGVAKLYSLADFKSEVRRDEKFEENYLRGKYGAVPFLGEFDQLIAKPILLSNENEK